MKRKTIAVLVLVILVVSPVIAPAIAAIQTVFVSGGTPVVTATGLVVKPANDGQYNLQDPWVRNDSLELRNVTFRSENGGEITVENFGDPASGGEWTNTSAIEPNGSVIYIDRPDTRQMGVSGSANAINVTQSNLSKDTTNTDVIATASGDWSLTVNDTGLSQGDGVVAEVAETGEALDAGSVGPNGNVVLSEMPATTDTDINLRRGPSELLVYQASEPSKLVDNAKLQIRFFSTDRVIERQVTNGKLDLTNIPPDERITITVSSDKGYIYRRVSIASTSRQQEIYLLNGSKDIQTATVQFNLDDRTGGRFNPETTRLLIERPITKDYDGDGTNETKYQVVSGDTVGSGGQYTATLINDERYRLRVVSESGNERTLGSYVVQGNAAPTLSIGEINIGADNDGGYAMQFNQFSGDTDGDGYNESYVRLAYLDEEQATTQLRYTITNESNAATVVDTAVSGPYGQYAQTIKVGENTSESTYRLEWTGERSIGGESKEVSGTLYAGDIPEIGNRLPIDGKWLSLIGYVSIVAIGGLLVIYDGALASLAAVGWSSLLTILGVVAIPMPALGLAAAVSVIALAGRGR